MTRLLPLLLLAMVAAAEEWPVEWLPSGHLGTRWRCAGRDYLMVIDTGAPDSYLLASWASARGLRTARERVLLSGAARRPVERRIGRYRKAVPGVRGMAADWERWIVAPMPGAGPGEAGMIGSDVLLRRHARIDMRRMVVTLR